MPEPTRLCRAVTLGVGSFMAMTLLAGCGGSGFDATESEPCDFLNEEELELYGLAAGAEDGDDFIGCRYTKKPGFTSSLTFVQVSYVSEPLAVVADDLGMTPVEDPDGGVTHKGMKETGDHSSGVCRLLAPIDDGTSMLVQIGVDGAGIKWSGSGKTFQPCAFVTEKYDDIQSRIRSLDAEVLTSRSELTPTIRGWTCVRQEPRVDTSVRAE